MVSSSVVFSLLKLRKKYDRSKFHGVKMKLTTYFIVKSSRSSNILLIFFDPHERGMGKRITRERVHLIIQIYSLYSDMTNLQLILL